MPILPSGRRIEYSLDRFHALLARMPLPDAQRTVTALKEPNDLLYVLDVVEFEPIQELAERHSERRGALLVVERLLSRTDQPPHREAEDLVGVGDGRAV